MSIFKEVANQIGKINVDSILQNIMNYDFTKEFVINTIQERIENTGIDAKNQKMQTNKSSSGAYGAYSKFTDFNRTILELKHLYTLNLLIIRSY